MNNNLRFDEHIREQFSDYAPEVHPRIWENIVAQRERRKPAGFWFTLLSGKNILLMTGVLLAAGTGAWIFFSKNSSANSEKSVAQTIEGKNTLNKDKSGRPGENNNSTGNKEQTATTATTTPLNSNENKTATNSPVVSNNTINASAVSRIRVYAPDRSSVPTNVTAAKDEKKPGNTGVINRINDIASDDNVSVNDNSPLQGSLLGRLMFGVQKISANRKTATLPKAPLLPFGLLPDCPALEKDAAGNKKYIELYAGPDMAMRSMSDTGNSAYLQKRKESTKVSSAYSAGARFTRVFSNSMSVRTGINYSQINEKFTFVQGNLVQITYIIDANGDTTGSYITRGTRYKTTYNKYRSIDVPLLVGFEVGNGKLHANINAGAVVNVYSWQKGDVLDTANQPVTITTGKGSSPYQFKTNAGIGFMTAVSVYYKLNDRIHVMAEPYFRYNLSQLNKENLTLKQKYSTLGLRLGVRVDLK